MLSLIKTTGISIVVSLVCICILHVLWKTLGSGYFFKKKDMIRSQTDKYKKMLEQSMSGSMTKSMTKETHFERNVSKPFSSKEEEEMMEQYLSQIVMDEFSNGKEFSNA
jgi:hypothetical protein